MKNMYKDGLSQNLEMKMEDYGPLVDEFTTKKLKGTTREIIEYLNDTRCTITPGLALRRYLCNKFATKTNDGYTFTLDNNTTIDVSDYSDENYNIETDELSKYKQIFIYINTKYNSNEDGQVHSPIENKDCRRFFTVTTSFTRQKMFEISFALHMDSVDMHKFLTDYLAEPTYNLRDPEEIIALYCHSHESVNNYINYSRILNEYKNRSASTPDTSKAMNNYTEFASNWSKNSANTEEDLYTFLLENRANFNGYSQTRYNEFMALYNKALKKTTYQALKSEAHTQENSNKSKKELHETANRANKSTQIVETDNNDLLAKSILSFIPRTTKKKYKSDGTYELSNEFISVTNSASGKKAQTTLLPKSITENLPLKVRLYELVKGKKPVERKDLVFFKFYIFNLEINELAEKTENFKFTSSLANMFIKECNDMLVRCGMSKLYPSNRFENLVLLSLYADNPFEFFEIILEYSFIYEADYVEIGKRGRKKKSDIMEDDDEE